MFLSISFTVPVRAIFQSIEKVICVCCHHKKFKLLIFYLFRPVSPRSKASRGGLGCWGGLASFLKWIYQDFRWTENTKSQIHHRIIMIVKFKEYWETLEGKSTCRHHRRKKKNCILTKGHAETRGSGLRPATMTLCYSIIPIWWLSVRRLVAFLLWYIDFP